MLERRRFGVCVCAAVLLLAAIGHPLATGEVYTETDLGNFHLPVRHFYAESIAAGWRFTWLPSEFTGFYLHGEGQAGLYHPLNYLLYRYVPLVPAFTLELLRNYVFALVGMYWLLRRWDLRRDAAMLGALGFAFCGFQFVHFMHIHAVGISAHLPWLLVAIDVALRDERPGTQSIACAGASLLIASQLLLGHPQFTWMTGVVEGLYALALIVRDGRRWRRLPGLLCAVAVGGLLAGVQVSAQLESLGTSMRATPPDGFASTFALPPLNLIQLVAPYLFVGRVIGQLWAEYSLYPGALACLSLIWLLVRRRQLENHQWLATATLALAALALLLSLGDKGLLYRLQSMLPVVGLFRAPARYILLFQLAGAVAMALTLSDLAAISAGQRTTTKWSLRSLALCPLASVVVAAYWILAREHAPAHPHVSILAPTLHILAGPLLALLVAGLALAAASRVRGALLGLVMFAALDLGTYGLSFMWRIPPTDLQSYLDHWEVPDLHGDRLNWGPPAMTMLGVRMASGYVAMTPQRRLPLGQFDVKPQDRAVLHSALRVAGVAWAYQKPVRDPLPRARMLPSAKKTVDLYRQLNRIDLTRIALVEESLELGGGAPGSAEILGDRPGEIEVRTRAPTRQLLVVSESHHSGWIATVDGEPCAIERVYGDFMGCVVDAGEHIVALRFDPKSLEVGKRLSAIGAGVVAVWLAFGIWRYRLGPRPDGGSTGNMRSARSSLELDKGEP